MRNPSKLHQSRRSSKQLRKPKSSLYFILFIVIFALATPVLADYLGPDRTRTESHVETYDVGVWARDDPGYPDNPTCNHSGGGSDCIVCTWERKPGNPCGNAEYSYKTGQESKVVKTTINLPPATISGSLQNCTLQNGWCITDPELLLRANEPLAGKEIIAIEGTWNGQTFACEEASCSVPLGEGDNSLTYWALSSWGDSSTMGSTSAKVDTVSPNVGLDASGSSGSNGWFISPVTLTPTGSDSTSGLAGTFVSVDSGAWLPSTVLNDGVYSIAVSASDNAGNVSNTSTTISVDTTTPSLDISVNGEAGSSGWYVSTMQITAAASDSTSGLALLEFSTDGGAYQSYTSPVSLPNGYHTVQFKATDHAGNFTEPPIQEFYVDATPPAISLPDSWTLSEVATYKLQDDGSGLASVRVLIEDENEHYARVVPAKDISGAKFTGEIDWDGLFNDGTVAPPGTYLVWVRASDVAGNSTIKLGKVTINGLNPLSNILQPDEPSGSVEDHFPPEDLFAPDELSTTNTTPPSVTFGGVTAETTESSTQSLLLTTGTSSATPNTDSTVLWGAAAAALVSAATAYALDEKRKRDEAEEKEARKAEKQAERLNEAEEQRKIDSWFEGQAILNAQIEQAKSQGASDAQIAAIRQTGATQGFGVAIGTAASLTESLHQAALKEVQKAHQRERMTEDEIAWEADWQELEQMRAQQAEQVVLDWRAGEQQIFVAPPEEKSWWDNTKSFVWEEIIQPFTTEVYEPYLQPIVAATSGAIVNSVTWLNENVYQPYVTPAIEEAGQAVSNGIEWVNENVYQPYIAPIIEEATQKVTESLEWINENIYQPYVQPAVEKTIEVVTNTFSWVNENVYQPYVQPVVETVADGIAWVNENVYQPYVQPYVMPLLQKAEEVITHSTSWVNENIYQPYIEPVVADINEYIFQPLVDKTSEIWEKYGEWVHGALDAAGFIPGLGEIADGLNGLIYLGEGRYIEAAVSALAMIPLLGDLGKAGKLGLAIGQEVLEEAAEKVIKEVAEEVAEKAVKESLEEVAEKALKETGEELANKVANETIEESVEKVLKETSEELVEKVAKESVEEIAENTLKVVSEEGVEKLTKEVADQTTKEAADKVVTKVTTAPATSADNVSKIVAEETVEESLEQASAETARLISTLTEKYGDDMVERFLPLCEKYGINPSDILTRPPVEGQSPLGWVLGIENPANPVNHPLVNLNLTDADLEKILKDSIVRPDSNIVVLGYGGGAAKPYYTLSDEIGGCHLSLSNEAWAPFETARANFWSDVNAPFLEKAIEDRKLFLFNVASDVITNPRNVERFSLPELRLIEMGTNNYVSVPLGEYTAFVPIELLDSYQQYLPASLLN